MSSLPAITCVMDDKKRPVRTPPEARFEQLYHEHVDSVLAYALTRTRPHLAIEVVESTFLVAWRRLEELPEVNRAWLFGVARRVLADLRRSEGRREALGHRIYASRAMDKASVDPADEVVERDSVLITLAGLPDADRELLCLVAWDGLTAEEAATALGCSKAAFKVRLHRARRRLESALRDGEHGATGNPTHVQLPPRSAGCLSKEASS